MAFKRIYNLRGGYYYQSTLLFHEYMTAKTLLGDKLQAYGLEEKKYAEAVDELFDSGKLRDLFQTILKEYNGTIFHRLVNKVRKRKRRQYVIETMDVEEVSEVVNDFFICNVSWMTRLTFSSEKSVSPMMRMLQMCLRAVGKLFTALHKRILRMQMQSGI